jgi:hypothetical protein
MNFAGSWRWPVAVERRKKRDGSGRLGDMKVMAKARDIQQLLECAHADGRASTRERRQNGARR